MTTKKERLYHLGLGFLFLFTLCPFPGGRFWAQAQQIAPILMELNFEDNLLPPEVTIHKVGDFIAEPGIKPTGHFNSTRAFGFGKTSCTANCWEDATATLRIILPMQNAISRITFDEAELEGNYGSTGYVYVDGHLVNEGVFERLPWNDLTADADLRHRVLTVNLVGRVIEFKVVDITSSCEMFIDNIVIETYRSATTDFIDTRFDQPLLPPPVTVSTRGTFNQAPGFRTLPLFDGQQVFGFGRSTCHINALEDYVTTLTFDVGRPVIIDRVVFQEAEVDNNWGGQGIVYIDEHQVPHSVFGRLPSNDAKTDTTARNHYIPVNRIGRMVSLKVWDITDISEILLRDLSIAIHAPGEHPVYFNGFEDNSLGSECVVQSHGNFTSPPGIKATNQLSGGRAFGFGLSDCPAGCWQNYQSSLVLTLPAAIPLRALKFKAMEIGGNWGSAGMLSINGQLWPSMDFSRHPVNDFEADASFREYYCDVGFPVHEIRWTVWDITGSSEIFIDDIELLSIEPGGVEKAEQQPAEFGLEQNYPNPFNSATIIRFTLPLESPVHITFFNASGQLVEERHLGMQSAGVHELEWQANGYPTGIYYCRIRTTSADQGIRLVLVR